MPIISSHLFLLFRHVASYLRNLAAPIIQQLPFFLLYVVWTSKAPLFSLLYAATHALDFSVLEVFEAIVFNCFKAYLICTLFCLVKHRWIKVVGYIVFFALALVYMFMGSTFRMDFSPMLLTLLAETNARESAEFVSTFLLSTTTLRVMAEWACIVAVAMGAEWLYPNLRKNIGRRVQMVIGGVALLIIACGCTDSKVYVSLFRTQSTKELSLWDLDYADLTSDSLSRIIMSARGIYLKGEEMREAVNHTLQIKCDAQLEMPADSLCVVFVIGESYIKYHSSLYGYPLPTAPRMKEEQQRGNLVAFTNVCAPYNNTTSVIRNLLSCNSLSHGESWNEKPYFPAVMRQAGYSVLFWDNQRDMCTNAAFAFALNAYLYHPEIRKYYSQTNKDCYDYDGPLIDDFFSNANLASKHSFVILHLVGQHVLAGERFPHTREFETFHTKDVPNQASYLNQEKRQFIADYDNATRYNDYLMGRLFDYFRQKNAVIIYLSDHGEEIYDYQDQMGRVKGELTPQRVKYQYDVPFIVWTSDRYRNTHSTLISDLEHAKDRPLMTDNAYQLILRLAGVRSSYYHPERDISSPAYRPSKRIIEDTADYDHIRWRID